jgi:hypothetical protein
MKGQTMTAASSPGFVEALHSTAPAADRADQLGLYGFLIGDWEFEATYRPGDGTTRRTAGEIHAGWVLGGRALQDVWIVPARRLPRPPAPQFGDFHGTTLRVYDPGLDAWHILWSDPWRQTYMRQLARPHGKDIVQDGQAPDGALHRWSFTEITPDSFRWTGERSADAGATWMLYADYRAHRVRA